MGVPRPPVRAGNRKVCLPLTRLKPSHISAEPKAMAIARFLEAFLALEAWIADFPLIRRKIPGQGLTYRVTMS